MIDKDRIEGSAKQMKGKLKEAAGRLTGSTGITKSGNGTLQLLGANTYNGVTAVTAGSLIVNSLGNSADAGPSSLGMASAAAGAALTLGNAGTTASKSMQTLRLRTRISVP